MTAGAPNISIVCEPTREHSIAAVARRLARLLEDRRPGCVRFIPVDGWGDDLSLVSAFEQGFTGAILRRPAVADGVLIWLHYPLAVPAARFDRKIAFFLWEDYPIPDDFTVILNEHYDAVVTKCGFVARVLVNSGVRIPIHVIGWAPDHDDLRPIRLASPGRHDVFTFLHISTATVRKGVDVLLRAYVKAFRRQDPVRLLLKHQPAPFSRLRDYLAALPDDPDRPRIEVVTANLDRSEVVDLYATADAVVLPTRGEGYNLPAAEAMAAGVPLIVTGYSAHLDFCDARTARLVEYQFAPSAYAMNQSPHAVWAEPAEDDLAAAMQEAVAMPMAAVAARRSAASRRIDAATAPDRFIDRFLAVCDDTDHGRRDDAPVRIAWVSSWGIACPIAAFSARLLRELTDGFAVTVICPGAEAPGATGVGPWNAPDLAEAVARAAMGADLVVVQHHPDLLAWRGLPAVLDRLAHLPVVVVLHRTRDLDHEPARRDVAIALGRATRVVVHTVADLNRLKALGLVDSVTMLPHDAAATWPVRRPAPVPRPFRPRARFLIGCHGFCAPGSGLPHLIAGAAILRRAGLDVRLRLVTFQQPGALSATVLRDARNAARANGMQDAITWHTGLLVDEAATALLAECDIVVFPDQYDTVSASGPARLALCAGAPVIVSPLAQFDDLGHAVARLSGFDAASIADGVLGFLRDLDQRIAVQHMAQAWLALYARNRIALRYRGMLAALRGWRDADPRGPG